MSSHFAIIGPLIVKTVRGKKIPGKTFSDKSPLEKRSPVKKFPKKRSLLKECPENLPREVERFSIFMDSSRATTKIYSTLTPHVSGTRKNGPRKNRPQKIGPRKNGPRNSGPRKNVLQKLFFIKTMLGNLNDFSIFINWFHYTQKTCLTFTSRSYMCTKL